MPEGTQLLPQHTVITPCLPTQGQLQHRWVQAVLFLPVFSTQQQVSTAAAEYHELEWVPLLREEFNRREEVVHDSTDQGV